MFSTKINLLYPPLFNSAEVLSSTSDKAKLFFFLNWDSTEGMELQEKEAQKKL